MSKNKATPVAIVVTTAQDQAPVLEAGALFTPYSINEYNGPCSSTLLEKANELARVVYNGPQGYAAAATFHPLGDAVSETATANREFFTMHPLKQEISKFFTPMSWSESGSHFVTRGKNKRLVDKLKQLEQKHDTDTVLDYDTRELIIKNVLFPASCVFDLPVYDSRNAHLSNTKAFALDLLTQEECERVESIINFVDTIRSYMKESKLKRGGTSAFDPQRLLSKTLSSQNPTPIYDRSVYLSTIAGMHRFLHEAFPIELVKMQIPKMAYPRRSSDFFDTLGMKSREFRDTSIGFATGKTSLSELLESILNISEALSDYYESLAVEIEACFQYLDKAQMSFEVLVNESKPIYQAPDHNDLPW